MPQVDFYVTEASDPGARLRLACRVTEKAFLAGRRVLVWCSDADELKRFDDLLWTFGERSFVPHEVLQTPGTEVEAPVVLSQNGLPGGALDVVVNLDAAVPPFALGAGRIAEVIDSDPTQREAGRARFRSYRENGLSPVTHQVRDAASL